MNRNYLQLIVLAFIFCQLTNPQRGNAQKPSTKVDAYNYSIQKRAIGNHGAVSSAHPLASSVGLSILKNGGNAFDAAIATQLALAVVYPVAGNLGGGGFLVGYTDKKKAITIDYREKAPSAATKNMYLDSSGNPLLNLSQNGHLASGVPGSVAGFFAAHQYGKLSFREIIQPAIDLAENGFAITASQAESFNENGKDFIKYSKHH